MKNRTVTATEFKAKCLAILDDVEEGAVVTVTRFGKVVAELKHPNPVTLKSPANSWKGKMTIQGDIVNYDTSHLWTVLQKGDPTNS